MNAEEVVKKICADANAKADLIRADAKNKADAENATLEAKLADYRTETDRLAKEAATEKVSRMLAHARMELRKEILTAKQAILSEVFEKAKSNLVSCGDDEYRKLMEKLLIKAVETGNETVIVGKDEKLINDNFIKLVNRNLGTGFKGNLLLNKKPANICGGFILRRENVQINVSIDVLVDQVCEELGPEIAAELFD
jgi:V/A-type H+/Na+-transporting ATPase subunit E